MKHENGKTRTFNLFASRAYFILSWRSRLAPNMRQCLIYFFNALFSERNHTRFKTTVHFDTSIYLASGYTLKNLAPLMKQNKNYERS